MMEGGMEGGQEYRPNAWHPTMATIPVRRPGISVLPSEKELPAFVLRYSIN